MQSKNAITIVHAIVGMRGMHKLCVCYLKVTIICRYIFLRFWNSVHFTGIKFCVG